MSRGDVAEVERLANQWVGSQDVLNWTSSKFHGMTALAYACHSGQTDCAKILLRDTVAVNVNKTTDTGESPLLLASKGGHIECLKLLLANANIDLTLANQKGVTALSASPEIAALIYRCTFK